MSNDWVAWYAIGFIISVLFTTAIKGDKFILAAHTLMFLGQLPIYGRIFGWW